MKRLLSLILIISAVASCGLMASSCGDDSDGGECQICGRHTNWTYTSGGYLCYSCDKKYN